MRGIVIAIRLNDEITEYYQEHFKKIKKVTRGEFINELIQKYIELNEIESNGLTQTHFRKIFQLITNDVKIYEKQKKITGENIVSFNLKARNLETFKEYDVIKNCKPQLVVKLILFDIFLHNSIEEILKNSKF